ncbi:MAG: dihydroxyacetone kinase subunit L [Deltaproteobacteria bacterium RBG_16_48_10]|nr:MAG: dihydroxyacetone kinase subunit L [Deltaproteobacteria bacterium RBG_16_48_10]
MRSTLSSSDFVKIINTICDKLEQEKGYLSELDGAIGDGDHGVNMAKCFREVKKRLPESNDKDVGTIFKNVGMVILNSVGGAMGALYGTLFLKASKEVMGKMEVNLEDLIKMFEAGEKGIQEMGKAQLGDKTLLDTIDPAVKALKEAQSEGKSVIGALAAFSEAAKKGADSTREMISKVGRSSRLGERTIGHQDAGATSCYFILNAFYQGIK